MTTDRHVMREMVARDWQRYAIPRFPEGKRAREFAWAEFRERSRLAFRDLRQSAREANQGLEFDLEHLQQLMLRGLRNGCELCGKAYGPSQAAVVWEEHPRRLRGLAAIRYGYRLSHLLPACGSCAAAIGLLSVSVWRDVLMALKAEPDWIAARFIAKAGGQRVLPKGRARK